MPIHRLGCTEIAIQRSLVSLANYASTFIQNKSAFSKRSIGPDAAGKIVEGIQKQARALRKKIEKAKNSRLAFDQPDGTIRKYSVDDVLNALSSLEYMFNEELLYQDMQRNFQVAGLWEAPKGGQGDRDLDQLFKAALAIWQANGGMLRRSNKDGEYDGPTLRFVKGAIADPCRVAGVPLRADKTIGEKIIEVRDSPYR